MALGFDANLSGLGFPSATHRRKDVFRIAREWQTFLAARARLTESASELWRRGAFHVEHFGRSGLGRYSGRGTIEQVLNERTSSEGESENGSAFSEGGALRASPSRRQVQGQRLLQSRLAWELPHDELCVPVPSRLPLICDCCRPVVFCREKPHTNRTQKLSF
jgi:hypothetical protein